jgi:hypothetical protein
MKYRFKKLITNKNEIPSLILLTVFSHSNAQTEQEIKETKIAFILPKSRTKNARQSLHAEPLYIDLIRDLDTKGKKNGMLVLDQLTTIH